MEDRKVGIGMALTLQMLSHYSVLRTMGTGVPDNPTCAGFTPVPAGDRQMGTKCTAPSETGGWELESQTQPDLLHSPQCL